jgi:hypothetical protein
MIMDKDEFRAACGRLGLSQAGAAGFFGYSIRTVHGWANGDEIPRPVAFLLRILVRRHLKPGSAKFAQATRPLKLVFDTIPATRGNPRVKGGG